MAPNLKEQGGEKWLKRRLKNTSVQQSSCDGFTSTVSETSPHCTLTPIPQRRRKEKIQWRKLYGWDKDTEIVQQLSSKAEQTQRREINIVYCLLITKVGQWETKSKLETASTHLFPTGVTGHGEWELWSVHNTLSPLLLHCHSESLLRDAVIPELTLCGLPTACSSSSTAAPLQAPLHGL